MDYKKKVFVNKDLSDIELIFIKSMLEDINIEEYLVECFVYIDLSEDGAVEIISIADQHVFAAAKELNVSHKMAIQYIRHKTQINQGVKKLLYWAGINDIKKYVPVKSNEVNQKKYMPLNVYAKDTIEAIQVLAEMHYDDYTYLEDVDEEI
jgi:hypothetical protein